jgi:dynein heavy chain
MKAFAAKLTGQLSELTGMVRGELGGDARRKVNTLVITDVHGRDIVDGFVRDSVMDAQEFAWESQLRFYWDRELVGGWGCGLSVCMSGVSVCKLEVLILQSTR